MTYVYLADAIAVLHTGYVLAVVLGLLATLLGRALGWEWVRNRWFRMIHLAMIVGVVVRTLIWNECPLTWWERDLRELSRVDYPWTTLGKFAHDMIHPAAVPPEMNWIYPVLYAAFAVLVVATLWLVPIRWQSRPKQVA